MNCNEVNIKFTWKKERNDLFLLLDALISNLDNKFVTSTYHKPKFRGTVFQF